MVINRLLHPPGWVLFLLPPPVFAALVYIFVTGNDDSAAAYIIYVMSAYCLTVLILPLPGLFKRAKAFASRQINSKAFTRRYAGDPAFRGSVGLLTGAATDFLYAVFRTVIGIRYASAWFISMAVYYLMLGILRLMLIFGYRRREQVDEMKYYRRTARLLFLLNLPMGGMILLTVMTDSGYTYPGYIIYLSAIYTFYTATMSVVNLIKYRRLGSPVLSAAKTVNFVAALMSVLGLQTAMIAAFSSESDGFRRMMNTLTGGGIWLTVIFTAVYMLCCGRKEKEMR